MRRIIGLILIALGIGVLTLGVALRYWAYPRVAVATTQYPTSKDQAAGYDPPPDSSISTGNVSLFVIEDTADGKTPQVKQLDTTATRTTIGDTGAASGNNVYYESRVLLTSPSIPGTKLNVSVDGVCFDKVTGRATTTCNRKNYRSDATGVFDDDVSFEGQVFKFPFGTKQRNYLFWDGVLGRGVTIGYEGKETLSGLTVYRFSQTIQKTTLEGEATSLPATMFGGTGSESVTAQQVYANKRTLWVEPETGAIIKGQEEQDRHFEANGQSVDILRGTLAYSDATVTRNIAQQKPNASKLHLIRAVVLPVGLIVGLLSTLAGLVLTLGARSDRRDEDDLAELQRSLSVN